METRKCNKCGHVGPLDTDFPRNKKYAGGYRPQCKTCHNTAARQWQKDNPEKFAKIQSRHNRKPEYKAHVNKIFQLDAAKRDKKNAMTRAWRERMRTEGKLGTIMLRHQLNGKYGKTLEEFDAQRTAQNNACAICREPFTKTPHNDHNHLTGENRGLLCSNCNHLLGKAKDSITVLQNAIDYLSSYAYPSTHLDVSQ